MRTLLSAVAIGIQVTPSNLSNTDFDADLFYGKYQMAYYDQQTFGPSAYYELNNWLNSANTAPVGKVAASNYERYNNAATTALLNQYATTTSAATQQTIMNKIQQAMLTDVPIIPVYWYTHASLVRTSVKNWKESLLQYRCYKAMELVPTPEDEMKP